MSTTVGLTFRDLILRVSETLGTPAFDANGALTLPTGYTLDRCKRIVNDAWRDFLASNNEGVGWRFLDQMLSLTFAPNGDGPMNIEGDPARYRLPGWYCDVPKRRWQYVEQSLHSEVRWASEEQIMGRRARNPDYTGYPELVCARRIPESVSKQVGYEAIFWPAPTEAEVIQTTARAQPYEMTETDTSEAHFAGREYDFAVLACCRAHAEVERYAKKGALWEMWEMGALPQAKALNLAGIQYTESMQGIGSPSEGWMHLPSDIVYNGEQTTATPD